MDWLSSIPQGYLALAGALFGGTGLKTLEYWLNKSKASDTSASDFRKELREEVTTLRNELRLVDEDIDKWRAKYYELMDQFIKVKGNLDDSMRNLKNQVDSDP